MKNARIFVAVVALIFVSSARADWQYTKWGMTPDQVIEASNGAAKEMSDEEKKKKTLIGLELSPLLITTYSSGKYDFTATFHFDKSNKLARVYLQLKNFEYGRDLFDDLKKKYGKPSDKATSQRTVWNTESDQIIFTWLSTSANIAYLPIKNEDNKGL